MTLFLFGVLCYVLVLIAEQTLARLSSHDLDILKEKGDGAARRVVLLAEQLRSSMAALMLARVLLAIILGVACMGWLLNNSYSKITLYNISQTWKLPSWLVWMVAVFLISLVLTLILWFFQKIDFFKGRNNASAFVLQRLSLYALAWKKVFTPFIKSENHSDSAVSDSEPEQAGNISSEKRELELIKSIVQFGDVTVKQVMQPRSKVIAVDFRASFPELLQTVCDAEFSRMPVVDEDLDNVTGILYVKDLVPHLDKPQEFEWQSLIRTNLMLVPESKRGIELLEEFKKEKMHMAVVVDEFGGSAGIVTLEDILEEVTGEIRDEFDEESEIRYRKLDDFNYLFEGQALLNDVCRVAGLPANTFDAAKGNSDTLAGLALELRGDIPPVGEEIAWGGYMLTIMAADSRKIEQLKFSLPKG